MIKHIWTIIWNQRRSNGWIFMELLLVFAVLWIMMDSMLVSLVTYNRPLGFDITNVYSVKVGRLSPGMPGYLPDSLAKTSEGEDLIRLVDNIRRAPEVEEAGISYASCPYTWYTSWSPLVRADADTSTNTGSDVNLSDYFQRFLVTPSYFDVLRMKDNEGHPLRQEVERNEGVLVVSADMEKKFFDGQSAKGQSLKWSAKSTNLLKIAAVSDAVRRDEFAMSEPSYYELMRTDEDIVNMISYAHAERANCLVRMKDGFRTEEMEPFLERMGEQLEVNNLYVSSVVSLEEFRAVFLKQSLDTLKKKCALVGFMLVNVFFGIIGTFWLRTQYRRGELGLRSALGASRSVLERYLNVEGLSLLAFTVPLILIFIANMLFFDLPDTYRLPYTWWRFLLTFGGSCLLLGGMIWSGIWFPARKIARMNPADALHYE